jgi:hypothetical protein
MMKLNQVSVLRMRSEEWTRRTAKRRALRAPCSPGSSTHGTLQTVLPTAKDWDEAELVDPSGQIWSGRAAIAQMHVDLWSGIFKGSRIAGEYAGFSA